MAEIIILAELKMKRKANKGSAGIDSTLFKNDKARCFTGCMRRGKLVNKRYLVGCNINGYIALEIYFILKSVSIKLSIVTTVLCGN